MTGLMVTLLLVTVSCVLLVVAFWLIVCLGYLIDSGFDWSIFFSTPFDHDPIDWSAIIRVELDRFRQDIVDDEMAAAAVLGGTRQDALLQSGIVENRRNAMIDETNALPGDSWLCDRRPLIFAGIQFVLTWVPVLIVSTAIFNHPGSPAWVFLASVIGFGVVTGILAYASFIQVEANERLGVKRWGDQLPGFLKTGLHFVVPFMEKYRDQVLPLKIMVWGPREEGQQDDQLASTGYLNGTAGGSTNPKPGVFKLPLLGRWDVFIQVQVTLRIAKSSKEGWYTLLNEYQSNEEVGQQIAAVLSSVLTRELRELTNPTGETEAYNRALSQMQDRIPEVAKKLMEALLAIRSRLPLVFLGIAVTGPIPGEELKQLLQVRDEASTRKLSEKTAGEAVKERSQQLIDLLATQEPHVVKAFLELNQQEVQRAFAQISQGNSLEAVLRAFTAGQVQNLTKPNSGAPQGPPTTPPTPPQNP